MILFPESTPRCAAATVVALLLVAPAAAAQKDYYNTDKNRPVRIEDAYTTERYALEIKATSLRLQRERGGAYDWGFEPEVAYGILPRTSIEVGFPFSFVDRGEGVAPPSGLTGIELSAFHNLNHETRTLPALGVRADATLPIRGGGGMFPAVTGIATRTFPWARFHANAQYTFGAAAEGESAPHDASRWLAGVAVDRAFPLDSYLLIADVFAEQPLHAGDPVEWNVGAGIRYQVNPYLAVDAGLGRRLGGDAAWSVTFGSAYHLGVRALMPRTAR
jgi:hypothetical protein